MEKEEEISNLLFGIGIKRNVARVLAFFTKNPAVTYHEIGRDTGLHQPEVVTVLQYLKKQGWITSRQNKVMRRGRPVKVYELAKPIAEIMNGIEKEKIKIADDQIHLIRKLRNNVRYDPAHHPYI